MIKFEKVAVMNMDNAIRGARNPMESWGRMDSTWKTWEAGAKEVYPDYLQSENKEANYYIMGENDLGLALRLRRAGSDHRKYLRQIFVSVDITAPMYWYKDFDTYKVGTVANSTSTMHKIHSKPINMVLFSTEELDPMSYQIMQVYVSHIEHLRLQYLDEKDAEKKKKIWDNIIQMLPSSFDYCRTITLNYENLVSIYFSRKTHKLREWREFCEWIETLPYAKELIIGE